MTPITEKKLKKLGFTVHQDDFRMLIYSRITEKDYLIVLEQQSAIYFSCEIIVKARGSQDLVFEIPKLLYTIKEVENVIKILI